VIYVAHVDDTASSTGTLRLSIHYICDEPRIYTSVCTYVCARGKGLKRVCVCLVQVVVKHRSELMKTNFAQIALTVGKRRGWRGWDYGAYTISLSSHSSVCVCVCVCILPTTPPATSLSSPSSESTNIMYLWYISAA